jgi:hypothetical protein
LQISLTEDASLSKAESIKRNRYARPPSIGNKKKENNKEEYNFTQRGKGAKTNVIETRNTHIRSKKIPYITQSISAF